MANDTKPNLPGVKIARSGNPVYEIIKKEDLEAAFTDALSKALKDANERIDTLIELYSETAPSSMWVWGFTSRWGLDFWG